jgi:hypothetical protein
VAIVTKPHGAATNKYEDNFGFYDLDADPNEAAFFAFIKAESGPAKCLRCCRPVQLQPCREICARCCEAMEYGGDRIPPND